MAFDIQKGLQFPHKLSGVAPTFQCLIYEPTQTESRLLMPVPRRGPKRAGAPAAATTP
jgi:hypothetical protein